MMRSSDRRMRTWMMTEVRWSRDTRMRRWMMTEVRWSRDRRMQRRMMIEVMRWSSSERKYGIIENVSRRVRRSERRKDWN
jgi:hypothetical protein